VTADESRLPTAFCCTVAHGYSHATADFYCSLTAASNPCRFDSSRAGWIRYETNDPVFSTPSGAGTFKAARASGGAICIRLT
jgi:hypothetical protein